MDRDALGGFVDDAARLQRFAEGQAESGRTATDRAMASHVVRQVKGLRKMLVRWARPATSAGTVLRSQ